MHLAPPKISGFKSGVRIWFWLIDLASKGVLGEASQLMKGCLSLAWLALSVLMATERLSAQSVIVTDPVWMDQEHSPATSAPHFRKTPELEYPAEMKTSDTVGYVIVPQFLDAKGNVVGLGVKGTNPYFESAVRPGNGKFAPVSEGGKPVEGVCWYAVVFNPPSAKETGSDVAPQLLSVKPVFIEKKIALKGAKLPWIAWSKMQIDENGVVQKITFEDESVEPLRSAIEKSVAAWRFAPARKDNQAIAAELRAPLMIVTPYSVPKRSANFSQPKVISRVAPRYPLGMKKSGMRGEVLLEFVVTKEGKIVNPVVLNSNHPGFNEAAMDALMAWKFEPGTRDGTPADIKMQLPFVFDYRDRNSSGEDYATVANVSKEAQEGLPEQFRYDVAPKIQGILVPVYPYPLLQTMTKGKTLVAFVVDEKGRVASVQVLEATKPEFGLAMTAAIESFTFVPALKGGRPTKTIMKMEQEFDRRHVDKRDNDLLALERKHPERIIDETGLGAKLVVVSRVTPHFPANLKGKVAEGSAKIEILINSEGKVCLPRIVEASDPAFGYAAVQAVVSWRFEPPKAGGKTVVARVQLPFHFGKAAPQPEAPKPAPPSEEPAR
ncbi:MAG: TonB family protein [Nibricoccus sp.]